MIVKMIISSKIKNTEEAYNKSNKSEVKKILNKNFDNKIRFLTQIINL